MLTNDLIRCKLFLIAILNNHKILYQNIKHSRVDIIINILLNFILIIGIIFTRSIHLLNLL